MSSDPVRTPAPTSQWERRLLLAAGRGDRAAQTRLLALYAPMVWCITETFVSPGGEHEDLAQQAWLGVLNAIRAWDPHKHVPFKSFARLCVRREASMAASSASAAKHRLLNHAVTLDGAVGADGSPLQEMLAATGRPDEDPVAKAIAREQLRTILDRAATLTELERSALALSANDRSHREIAATLGVSERAVNNALQRARHKLHGRGDD